MTCSLLQPFTPCALLCPMISCPPPSLTHLPQGTPPPALAFASSSTALPPSQHGRQAVPLQKHRLGLGQQKPSGLGIKEINCPEQCTSCAAQGVA